MNDVFINFRANVSNVLSSLGIVIGNFGNLQGAALKAKKAFDLLAQTIAGVVLELKNMGNILLLIGNALKNAGFQRAAAAIGALGGAMRQLSNSFIKNGQAFQSFITSMQKIMQQSPALTAVINNLANAFKLLGQSSTGPSGMERFLAGVRGVGAGIQGAGSAIQHLGFVLGVIGYQFKQLQTATASLFAPILKEGIELEKTLADVKAVSSELNEDFQLLSTQVLSATEITDAFNQLLQRVSGTSEDFSGAIAKSLEGIEQIGSSDAAFSQLINNLPEDLKNSSLGVKQVIKDLKELQASGANATQAILALTARENFRQLDAEVARLARTTKFSAKEIAEGAKFLALAGFNSKDLISSLSGIANLAAAAGLEIEKAADIAVNALLAFRLETFSLNSVVDAFAVVSAKSNSEVEGLAASLRYVAPAAEAAGLSLQETLAALGILADVGIRGTSAGTSLNNFLKSIAQRSDKFNEVLDELNINFEEINPELVSFAEILERLEEAGPSPSQLFRAFNIRGQRFIQAAITQTAARYKELLELLKSGDLTGFEIASTKLKTIAAQLELITSQLSEIGKNIFDVIRPQLSQFLTLISVTVTKFSDFVTGNQEMINGVAKLAAGLFGVGTAMSSVLLLLSGPVALIGLLTGMAGAIIAAAAAIPGLNTALLIAAGAFTLLVTSVGAATAVISAALPDAIRDLEASLGSIVDNAVKPFIEGFISVMKRELPLITQMLRDLFKSLSVGVGEQDEFRTLGEEFATTITLMTEVILGFTLAITENFEAIKRWYDRLSFVANPGGSLGRSLGGFLGGKDSGDGSARERVEEINVVLKETDDLLKATAQSFGETTKKASQLRSVVTNFAESLQEFSVGNVKNSKDLLEQFDKLVKETGETDPKKIFEAVSGNIAKQLEAMKAEYLRVQNVINELQKNPNSFRTPALNQRAEELKSRIAALKGVQLDIDAAKESFDDLVKAGIIPADKSFEEFVKHSIALGEVLAAELETDIDLIRQNLKDLMDENSDLEIEILVDMAEVSEGALAAKFEELRLTREKELNDINKAIQFQQDRVDFLGQSEIRKTLGPGEFEKQVNKLQALLHRRFLLTRKFKIDEQKLNKEKAEEEKDLQDKLDKEKEKKLEERKKAVDFLREAEIEALKAEGRELAAINKQYEFDVEKIKNDIAELKELTDEERKKALDNAIEGAKAKRDKDIKDFLEDQNKEQDKRTKKAEEAADYEKDIFKSLLGEVKNARDLIALYITLNQLQAARVFSARAAAQETLRQNIRLERIEERLEKARKTGNKNEIDRLKRLRDRAAIDNQFARDLAVKQAQDVGAGGLANMIAGDLPQLPGVLDLRTKLKEVKTELEAFKQTVTAVISGELVQVFAQAPGLWANAFLARWAVESVRIVQAIQSTLAQVNFSSGLVAAGTAAAGAAANVAAGGFVPTLPFLPDVAAGAVPVNVPIAPQAPQAVNINVIDNLGLNRVQNAIASQLVRAGHSVGRV